MAQLERTLPLVLFVAIFGFAYGLGAVAAEGLQPPDRGRIATPSVASGYSDDRSCRVCHDRLYDSYQEVGMARSFSRPGQDRQIEDFPAVFFHEASNRHYEIRHLDDGLLFRRYQLDRQGNQVNEYEQRIDWILGSGNHARTYLYQTELGELFLLPIAWYSQSDSWGMAPGFDRPDHLGVTHRVQRECMFCHNAYPAAPTASDQHWQPHRFPSDLPEGTGCQRCHGPGAEHAELAWTGRSSGEVRQAIVNPGRLPPDRRDDVCFSCHLQPSVAIPGIRRYERGDYSFQPGEPLDSYLLHVDIQEAEQRPEERFEINHHPYRLMQSKCYQASSGRLNCLTCHDPHRKVPTAERASHYRAACLGCHEAEACQLDAMGASKVGGVAIDDCATCHMPKRRTQDVVNVIMTDHTIQRRPGGVELLAARPEREPNIIGLDFFFPKKAPQGSLREIYRAAAVLRVGKTKSAVTHLEQALAEAPLETSLPYLDLASGQLHLHQFDKAVETLQRVLGREPDNSIALAWMALAKNRLSPPTEVLRIAQRAVELTPDRPESRFNLGLFLLKDGQISKAVAELQEATRLRPNMATAWFFLGEAHRQLENPDAAIAAYERSLAVEPSLSRAYLGLGNTYLDKGDRSAAASVWRNGLNFAKQPDAIASALSRLEADP